ADRQNAKAANIYNDGYLMVDMDQGQVTILGERIKLTSTEFRLLTYFLHHPGQVLTFEQILTNVWGWGFEDNAQYVHVYVSHLRKKLEKHPPSPRYFITEYGVGYRFEMAGTSTHQINHTVSSDATLAA
ncbi:MAG: winged helix-turn-helix domain-containing protein, partial [Anaerolineae bacterium]|nr:winged helix-turn-helix domain-containing protein [Anaerolineae bacterium]